MPIIEPLKTIQRLEFYISYHCFDNCLFCSLGDQIKKFKGDFVSCDDIKRKLIEFCCRGFNHITFTGGEPTLHPDFIEILQFTKQLGYRTFMGSIGSLFASRRFCQKTLPYIDEICFSLHGHNAKLHNFHTQNKTSFGRLRKALKNIEETSEDIDGFINIVVTKYNFDFLEKIINSVSCYSRIKQILISNLAPEGNGLHNFEELAVPIKKMKEKIDKIVNLTQKQSKIVRFFGLPLCALKNYENFSNDVWWSPRVGIDKCSKGNKTYLKTTLYYKPTRSRIKTKKCYACLKHDVCGGVFKKYRQIYGDNELAPF